MAVLHVDPSDPHTPSTALLLAALAGISNIDVVKAEAQQSSDSQEHNSKREVPVLTSSDGTVVIGRRSIFRYIISQNESVAYLLGNSDAEKKDVDAWVEHHDENILALLQKDPKKANQALHKENKSLVPRVFLVSNHLTLADLVFFVTVHPIMSQWSDKDRVIFSSVTRWFDHIQHLPEVRKASANMFPPIKINLDVPLATAKGKENQTKEDKGKQTKDNAEAKPKEESKQLPKTEEKPQEKQREKVQKGKEQQPPKESAKGAGTKKGGPKEEPPKSQLSATEDVSRLDIRVGKIINCKKHEGADSLYVEEIDVGEEKPRQVVSGLVKFIPFDEMQNRRVALLCNLKPSNLKGVRSQAMVLAASNEDHTKVELIEPPEGAVIGEKVTFEGFPGDPEKTLKKETLDAVLPGLKTNDKRIATYKGVPFTTSAGPCFSRTIANGLIK
jgi:aminoacyl tRNA synthase complex-interacting multifunctional protein 1